MEQLQQMLDNKLMSMEPCPSAIAPASNSMPTPPQQVSKTPKPSPILPLITSSQSRVRTLFSKEQLAVLEAIFALNIHYPEIELRHRIAEELSLHETQITIWFKNRRARKRLGERLMMKAAISTQMDSTSIKAEPDDEQIQPQPVLTFDPNNVSSPAEH